MPFRIDTGQGTVIYLAEKRSCRRFPNPASPDLFGGSPGVARHFQVFDSLDFIAELTQHIPDPRTHRVRYFGWCLLDCCAEGNLHRPCLSCCSWVPPDIAGPMLHHVPPGSDMADAGDREPPAASGVPPENSIRELRNA